MSKIKKPRILFYDIETTLILLWTFSLGKTVLRFNQLLSGYFSRTHVICITYKWSDEKEVKILTWGDSIEDEKKMLQDFDRLVEQADVIIGKNSNRFDNKHMNTVRMWHDLPGTPDWTTKADDLEVQMRRNFYLPSYALDYLSAQLGFGGKDKMEFSDWTKINNYRMIQIAKIKTKDAKSLFEMLTGIDVDVATRDGKKALKKMYVYGKKDTADTQKIWDRCAKQFKPKFNMATHHKDHRCTHCGSTNIRKNGTRAAGTVIKQHFFCNSHNGYAGKASIKKDGTFGKIS